MKITSLYLLLLLAMNTLTANSQNYTPQKIDLWPAKVPGETKLKHSPVLLPDQGDNIARLTDVTDPGMLFYDNCRTANGAAVIVCPGGGYGILAIDLEGYEVAKWLNSLGIKAFVLQYRVPDRRDGALQDLQRAVRLVRENAVKWNIDTTRIGVMGFSAGASLSARICALPDSNLYPLTDRADLLNFRPDFSILVYPAYLDDGPGRSISPEAKPMKDTPPSFVFATADDPYGNSALVIATALRDAQIPVELHFLPYGGHGYGLRQGKTAAETWPGLAEAWLNRLLKTDNPKPVR